MNIDLVALIGIAAALVGTVATLIHHTSVDAATRQKLDDIDTRLQSVETAIRYGILPRADERIKQVERELEAFRHERR